ncbi:MAG: MTH1187 family thiamine-binding protein [Deltaproteobacteria bacterium]|nr:MAG: MTH1187 family thiamine-binding protein [Deltaproteobacteria bacterium]TNF29606.1 MAG: MTH1187 family thiamine-binding protein [Deltaproteobacteria bacterium]
MKVMVDICLVPLGVGVSVSSQVAECQRIFSEYGLTYKMHGYGTNLEGEWDDVMAAIKACHERLHADGVPRITSSLRMGTRIDREQTLQDKIESVENKLKPE